MLTVLTVPPVLTELIVPTAPAVLTVLPVPLALWPAHNLSTTNAFLQRKLPGWSPRNETRSIGVDKALCIWLEWDGYILSANRLGEILTFGF